MQPGDLRGAPAALAGDDLIAVLHALDRPHHDRLDHAVLFDRVSELADLGIGKIAARIARIRFDEFDRHLALCARPLQMRGLAADISDQTCKTAAQSGTRFVGHRQLPWIQLKRSCFTSSRHPPSFRGARESREPGISTFSSPPRDSGSICVAIVWNDVAWTNARATRARAGSLRSQA